MVKPDYSINTIIPQLKDKKKPPLLDSLTGFYNKYGFERDFSSLLAKGFEPTLAVAIKVRNVKDIQLNYGYQVFEFYLYRLASKIRVVFKRAKLITFLHPDIFIGIFDLNYQDREKLTRLAEQLSAALQGPFPFKGSFFPIKVSLSLCRLSSRVDPCMLLNVMIRLVEKAPQGEKFLLADYDHEKVFLEESLPTYLSISKKIAMGDVGFALQPIYHARRGRIAFYEALVRLVTKKEILPPARFMSKVEKLKLKADLERAVFYKILVYLQEHREIAQVSINISLDYIFERLQLDLAQYTKELHIDPKRICFEVTEQPSSYASNRKGLYKILNKLKNKGFKIALDDFGLYHSNFGLLRDFPWDLVKIDGSFIQNTLKDKFDAKLVGFLVEIAELKGFKIVAEYVDSKELADYLKKVGIHYLQGFLYGKPRYIPESTRILPPLLYNFPSC